MITHILADYKYQIKVKKDANGDSVQFINLTPSVVNVVNLIEDYSGFEIKYNVFTQYGEVRHSLLTGNRWVLLVDYVYELLERGVTISLNDSGINVLGLVCNFAFTHFIRLAVDSILKRNCYDPVVDWIDGQMEAKAWDNVPRVGKFLSDVLGVEQTEYLHAVSTYLWTSLVGRQLSPGCKADCMVILYGEQGNRKSSLCNRICLEEELGEDYMEMYGIKQRFVGGELHKSTFMEDMGVKTHADEIRERQGKLVIEMGELSGLLSRKSAGTIKQHISSQSSYITRKYKEHTHRLQTRYILVGTTNLEECLDDPTGNRRFFVVEVLHRIDTDYIDNNRCQLWVEAAMLFKQNGVMFGEAELLNKEVVKRFNKSYAYADEVYKWMKTPASKGGGLNCQRPYLTLSDIMSEAGIYTSPSEWGKQSAKTALGIHLKEIGFIKTRSRNIGGSSVYYYVLDPAIKIDEFFGEGRKIIDITVMKDAVEL